MFEENEITINVNGKVYSSNEPNRNNGELYKIYTPSKFQRFLVAIHKTGARIKSFFLKCVTPETSIDDRTQSVHSSSQPLQTDGISDQGGDPAHSQEGEERYYPSYIADSSYPTSSTDTRAYTITTTSSYPAQHFAKNGNTSTKANEARMTQLQHPTIKDRFSAIPDYVKQEFNKIRLKREVDNDPPVIASLDNWI